MHTLTSKDGTRIAYEKLGAGPPLVCVDGAFCSRKFGPFPKLAPLLAQHFTVFHYDRRGRGDSSDTAPHSVEREVEDLLALVDVAGAGGPVHLYGTSSGAVLAARAAAVAGARIRKLAMHEPPLALDGTHVPSPADYREQITRALAEGRRGDAVKLFMRVVGVPGFVIAMMRVMPGAWRGLTSVAHTLPYDFAILGDTQSGGPLPEELERVLEAIHVPTLALSGGKSPPWMAHAVKRVAESVARGSTEIVPGQHHNIAAKAAAPVLTRFFLADAATTRAAA